MAKINTIIGAKVIDVHASESGLTLYLEKDGRRLSLVAIADCTLEAEWDTCIVSFFVDVQEQFESLEGGE